MNLGIFVLYTLEISLNLYVDHGLKKVPPSGFEPDTIGSMTVLLPSRPPGTNTSIFLVFVLKRLIKWYNFRGGVPV